MAVLSSIVFSCSGVPSQYRAGVFRFVDLQTQAAIKGQHRVHVLRRQRHVIETAERASLLGRGITVRHSADEIPPGNHPCRPPLSRKASGLPIQFTDSVQVKELEIAELSGFLTVQKKK